MKEYAILGIGVVFALSCILIVEKIGGEYKE